MERLGRRWQAEWRRESRFRSRLARVRQAGERLFLCQPETFMNASGEAVAAVAGYYRVPPGQMLLVVDDADLGLGTLRMRPGGSSGGHHGLESVRQHLGTSEFARVRIGIGRQNPQTREITDYVLSRFTPPETELLEKVLERVCDQIECWWHEGISPAMSRYNGVIKETKATE